MDEQLAWIRQAQLQVAGATAVDEVRQAIQSALNRFQAAGLKMPVGLLTELHQKALQATDADLATIKSELGISLKNMLNVHEAMIDLARRTSR